MTDPHKDNRCKQIEYAGVIYPSQRALAEVLGVSPARVSQWRAKGNSAQIGVVALGVPARKRRSEKMKLAMLLRDSTRRSGSRGLKWHLTELGLTLREGVLLEFASILWEDIGAMRVSDLKARMREVEVEFRDADSARPT